MAKQLNVALNFTAETGQAKAAIQELQQSLSKIAYAGTSGNIVGNSTQQIKEASEAAKQLQYHLNNAYNATTGNFDLSRLDKSLQTSKTNIADLSAKLLGAGTAGQQAFAQLAQSISMADQPMFRVNAKLTEMLTTLKNTARWQISSSILHGFMGTIQHAYGYAQDLNESLNNIRIITGQSVDQMAKFAEQANKSAKALSTTTTEYTNASLIYYQQGLSDAEVQERTDVTIKMANAAGVSAQTVSDQMTAVWNNFDDGSKSLEYYADVMTALGAATASSTDEIAAGLEKFAAVSETVGLSYEYATAALATVTATTRQSADIVGNAFKTLFARIQGLQLGETLEDGTTLNKYSQALEKVGISIFEQNGEMKEMDKILDEMGAKWDTLDKAQQTALAQTVAGVRQYTQLVALMDKWDYFKENLGIAYGAEGELDKQAEIYAESWEAARDRVSAAAEDIYNDLLDDKFFITINNGFANLLTGVGEFVEGIGGAKGVITAFGSIFLTNFAHKMPEAVQNLQYNLALLTKGSAQAYKKIQVDIAASTEKAFSGQLGSTISKDSAMGFSIDSANQLAAARLKLSMASSKMTDAEKQLAQMELSLIQSQQQEIISIKQKNEALMEEINLTQKVIESGEVLNTEKIRDKAFKAEESIVKRRQDTESIAELDSLDEFHNSYSRLLDGLEGDIQTKIGQPLMEAFNKGLSTGKFQEVTLNLSHLSTQVEKIKNDFNNIDDVGIEEVRNRISDLTSLLPNSVKQSAELRKVLSEINKADSGDQMNQALDKLVKTLTNCKIPANDLKRILSEIYGNDRIESLVSKMTQYKNGVEKAEQATNRLKAALAAFQPTHMVTGLEAITAAAAGLGNLAMGLTSIKSAFQALSNPDLSGFEKFTTILTSISMIIPMGISMMKNYAAVHSYWNSLVDIGTSKILANNIALIAQTGIQSKEAAATSASLAKHILKTAAIEAETEVQLKGKTVTLAYALAEAIAEKGTLKAAIAYLLEEKAIEANTAAKLKNLLFTQLFYAKILLVVAAIGIVAAIISKLVVTQKEANEAIDEANQKYDEENQKLKDLESQLKSVQDRIKELQALGTLSITEQKELNNLKEQEASLQRQIAMQEELTKAAQRNQANEIAENWGKSQKLTEEKEVKKLSSQVGSYETLDQYKARMGFEDTKEWAQDHAETYQKILEWQKEIDDNHAKWLEENKEQIQANEDNYSSYMEAIKAGTIARDDEKIAEMQGDLKDQRQKIYGDNYDEKVLSPLIDGLSRAFVGDFKADGSTDWSKKVSKESLDAAGVSEADFDAYMDKMVKTALESSDKVTSEELAKLSLDELTILFNNIEALKNFEGDNLIDFINGVKAEINSFDLSSWKNEFNQTKEIIDGLETGDEISAEDYNLLGEEYQRYFTVQSDGTAILTGKVEELKALIDDISLEKLRDEIWALQDKAGEGTKAYSGVVGREVSSDYITGIAERMLADANAGNAETWAGSKAEEGMIAATGLDVSSYETAEERIKALAQAWLEVQNALNGYQETLASTAESVDQLEEWFQQGLIDKEEKNNYYDSALIKESQSEDILYEEVEAYSEILQENNELLKDNEQFSKKVALAHKKTQKGVDKLAEVWDEFNEAVAIKDYQKLSKLMPKINDSLKDVLNLSDESFENLSSDFAVKNMDLLNDVINGVEGSLEELQAAAATDILINMGISDSVIEEAQSMLSELAGMAEGTELKIEPEIDNANAFDGLMELLEGAGMTADQIMSVLDSIGWDPQVEYVPIDYDTAQSYFSSGSQQVAVLNAGGGYDVISVPLNGEQTLSEDTQYYIPKIVGAKKSSGGGGSYSPPKNNKGGGGGGKQPKHAEKKNDSDKTRYHTILNQLEDLEAEYDKIADASDRAFGAEKLAKMDDEIAKTEELIKKQEEYVDAIKANLPVDKSIMEAYYNDVIGGPAIQFDEKGNISNYDEIQDAMFAKYNAMTAYDEESEQWQVFEKKYEQLEKYIEQYEETYDLLRDEEAAYQELLNQRLDLMLEQIQYGVELKLNLSDDSLSLIEYQLELLEDDAFKAADAIVESTKKAQVLYNKMEANRQGIEDILESSELSEGAISQILNGDLSILDSGTFNFTEAQIEAIKEYRDNLLDLNQEMLELRESVEDKLMESFDELNSKLQDGIGTLDHYESVLGSFKNIVDIVGKDTLGISDEFMDSLNEATMRNAVDQITGTKAAYESIANAQQEAEKALADAKARGDDMSVKMWEETLAALNEEMNSAQEEMLSAWEDALSSLADIFAQEIENLIEKFNDSVYALGGLEGLSEDFSRVQDNADMMVEDYEKMYELSKLSRDINKTIDETDNIAGKQKMKKLLEDINKLEAEGVEMSQYDLEYLQKTYDLRLAELELEEARNAKNTVRLAKDNEGNWSYVYTQNTDAVDAAQQKYEDALYAMQDLSKNYIDEMSDKVISTQQEMLDKLANLDPSDFASLEDYYTEVERINEVYSEMINTQVAEMQKAIDNNQDLYKEDIEKYSSFVKDEMNLIVAFKDTVLGGLLDSESEDVDFTTLLGPATEELMTGMQDAARKYFEELEIIMSAAGTSTENFTTTVGENIEGIKTSSKDATVAIQDMATDMEQEFQKIAGCIISWQEDYQTTVGVILEENLKLIESYNELIATLSGLETAKVKAGVITVEVPENEETTTIETDGAASGGYTGEWGPEGKLAWIHEKELILNADDTKNFLDSLIISKHILDTIDLNARVASAGIGAPVASGIKDNYTQTLEQMVTITAEFPNVNDHNEIEEALNSLVNTASQYANRK